MEKLYVNEIHPNGEVSTVGLFYSRGEAEKIVAQLRSIPEKSHCRYEISATVPSAATRRKNSNLFSKE
ncbi:MAG: hypothetical protein ACREQW_22235 [Candidatus Binatia bacterium]